MADSTADYGSPFTRDSAAVIKYAIKCDYKNCHITTDITHESFEAEELPEGWVSVNIKSFEAHNVMRSQTYHFCKAHSVEALKDLTG